MCLVGWFDLLVIWFCRLFVAGVGWFAIGLFVLVWWAGLFVVD